MKKILCMLLCLLCALALPLAAFAGDVETDMELEGVVKEVVEGGFLMEDIELGEIMLNMSDATVWDGMITPEELTEGQYVLVQFDGRTTRSLPPQAHADRIIRYTIEGVVSDVYEDGFLLSEVENHGEVIVHTAETMPLVAEGMLVSVCFDGAMTMSLPAQVGARHIEVPMLTGTVSEKTEEGFLLTDNEGVAYEVLLTDETLVGLMEEPIIETTEEAAEEGPETIAEGTPTEEAEIPEGESTIEWGDGDRVTVYYNGMMTRSLPAQLTAMEVVVER